MLCGHGPTGDHPRNMAGRITAGCIIAATLQWGVASLQRDRGKATSRHCRNLAAWLGQSHCRASLASRLYRAQAALWLCRAQATLRHYRSQARVTRLSRPQSRCEDTAAVDLMGGVKEGGDKTPTSRSSGSNGRAGWEKGKVQKPSNGEGKVIDLIDR